MSIGRWRHINCLDMDLEVQKVQYIGPRYIVVNVIYLNRNWQQGNYVIYKEKNMRIQRSDLWKWRQIA